MQQRIVEAMSDEDYEALPQLVDKAIGWMLVGAGGRNQLTDQLGSVQ